LFFSGGRSGIYPERMPEKDRANAIHANGRWPAGSGNNRQYRTPLWGACLNSLPLKTSSSRIEYKKQASSEVAGGWVILNPALRAGQASFQDLGAGKYNRSMILNFVMPVWHISISSGHKKNAADAWLPAMGQDKAGIGFCSFRPDSSNRFCRLIGRVILLNPQVRNFGLPLSVIKRKNLATEKPTPLHGWAFVFCPPAKGDRSVPSFGRSEGVDGGLAIRGRETTSGKNGIPLLPFSPGFIRQTWTDCKTRSDAALAAVRLGTVRCVCLSISLFAWIIHTIVYKNTYPSENFIGAIEKSSGEYSRGSRLLSSAG
jgi:hypothetical protein